MFFLREEFSFPVELAQAFCQAQWGAVPTELEITRLGKSLRTLWEELALHRGLHSGDSHYSFKKDQVEAYASYYLPANALKTAVVLEESFLLGKDIFSSHSNHWLDLGTGPGTGFWGLAWWSAQRGRKFQFSGWDQSPAFMEKARNLTRHRPFGFTAEFSSSKGKKDWLHKIETLKPTHVSFINSVAEIFPDLSHREIALKEILGALRKLGGERYLLIIEPGSRESSRELAQIKDAISASTNILLPCLDQRPCGALKNPNDWCHEEAACDFPEWMNQLGSTANLRKESLLFSYALFSTEKNSLGLDGGGRMVSQRMERKGQTECFYCMPNAKQKIRVQNSKSTDSTKFFFDSCRGDLLKNISIGEKGDLLAAEQMIEQAPSIFYK